MIEKRQKYRKEQGDSKHNLLFVGRDFADTRSILSILRMALNPF